MEFGGVIADMNINFALDHVRTSIAVFFHYSFGYQQMQGCFAKIAAGREQEQLAV
jgi:hypothetical protein